MTQTLIEIGDDLKALADLLDEAADEGGELGAEAEKQLDAWFAELAGDLANKADDYAGLIRSQKLLAAVAKEESERMRKLAQVRDNLASKLSDRMKEFMEESGQKKIETRRFKLAVCGNGGVQPLEVDVEPSKLPAHFQKIKVEADQDAIRSALKDGETFDFARLSPRGTHLRIS